MTAQELLEQINQLDEHTRIEAKRASELGESVLESVCAFANEPGLGGGWILLGVAPRQNSFWPVYDAVGVPKPDQVSAELATRCVSEFNQPHRVQIETTLLNEKPVLVVFVPELPASQKPLYFKKQGLPKGAFRRIGSTDQHCTDDDLLVFYQDRRGETFDCGNLNDSDISHLDPDAITEYRRIRADVNPNAEELRWSDNELLEALGCLRKVDGSFRPTVAGVLLFGKSNALRRFFPMTRIDYIRVPGREWVRDPDRRFDTVEIRAPLIRAIRRAHSAILDDLPKAFSLPPGELERQEIPLIPDRVIREAVVNAVMHRSYRVHGSIQIIRYANRLEIRNPGHSLKAEDRLGEPGSETRNPYIAGVLHETNLAETKGSGIRVMRELMTAAALTPPTFESDRAGNQFIVTMLFHHFLSPEDWEWLRQFSDAGLSDEEARALVFVRETGAITNLAYRDLNHVDTLNASTHLRRLRDRELLEMRGKGTATFYLPTLKLLSGWLQRETNSGGTTQSGNPSGKSGNLNALSGNLNALSGNLRPETGKAKEEEESKESLSPEIRAQIDHLPKRVPPKTLQDLVVMICTNRPWSVDGLAKLLDRDRQYILENYVSPMVRAGCLEMTIPSQPNHPNQQYRSVEAKHTP